MRDKKEIIKVLKMIAQDQENDATNFNGKPFNGRTVAEYFGNQGAAIAVLANIIGELVEAAQQVVALENQSSVAVEETEPTN